MISKHVLIRRDVTNPPGHHTFHYSAKVKKVPQCVVAIHNLYHEMVGVSGVNAIKSSNWKHLMPNIIVLHKGYMTAYLKATEHNAVSS